MHTMPYQAMTEPKLIENNILTLEIFLLVVTLVYQNNFLLI